MAKIRRVIRRLKSDAVPAFDEQLWPINIALIVLGAYTTGELWIFASFTTLDVWSNGFTWLAVVWIGILLVMWAAWRLGDYRGRRLQFSAVLAMLCVQWMLTASLIVPAFNAPEDEVPNKRPEVARQEEKRPPVTLPEYHVVPEDQPEQQLPHEKPVETETKETEKKVDLPRPEPTPTEVTPKQPSPEQVQDTPRRVQAQPIEKREMKQATPRHSNTASKLSRQLQPTQQAQPDQVASPSVAKSQPKAANQVEAQTPAVARQKTAAEMQRPVAKDTPQTMVQQPKVAEARQQPATRPEAAVAKTDPTPRRETAQAQTSTQPVAVPNLARAEPVAAAASAAEPTTSPKRQQSQSPLTGQAPAEIKVADAAPTPAPSKPRDQPAPAQPTLARAAQTAARAAEQASAAPTTTQAVVPQVATTQQAQPQNTLAARSESVSRQAAASPNPAPAKPTIAEVASNAPTAASGATRPQNSTTSAVPSIRPTAEPAAQARTALQLAQATASPVQISSPAPSQSAESNQRATDARKVAIDRGAQGTAGAGVERNFDRGEAAPRSVTDVASAAARRERATSASPDPSALSTSGQAQVARDKAMAQVASSTAKAESLEVATQSGSQRPADVDASASAAVQQSSAATAVDRTTADVGTTDVDFGPSQVAGHTGVARAAGGGEPVPNLSTQVPDASRLAPTGGAALAASDTAAVAPTPVDVASATGGGRPNAPEADSRATAATRADNSTGKTADGGPVPPSDALAGGGATAAAAGTSQPQRATATDALPGASMGGGTGQPSRETGVQFAAAAKADVPSAASGPSTMAQGAPGDSAGTQPAGPATGVVARQENAAVGGAAPAVQGAGDEAASSPVAASGSGPARAAGAPEAALATSNDAGGAPLKNVGEAGLSGVAKVDLPNIDVAGGGPKAAADAKQLETGAGEGAVQRQTSGGTTAVVQADAGVGGLGDVATPSAGSVSRSAQPFSEVIVVTDSRFRSRDVGGPKVEANPYALDGRGAFIKRIERPGPPGQQGSSSQRSRQQDPAVVSGLEFLRRHQSKDGSWSLHNFGAGRKGYEKETASIRSDTAGTGLALLAFLGARHFHMETEGPYNDTIRGGLEFLIGHQSPNGDLYFEIDPASSNSARFYSHAIATLALCEAYGMTGDPKLREPAQKAIDFAIATQHKTLGGWRYRSQISSDTSVTGWMFGALDAGLRAGLTVPPSAFAGIDRWLETASVPDSGGSRYVYDPNAVSDEKYVREHLRRASPAMTAVALYVRLTKDWKPEDPRVKSGADYLLEYLPEHTPGLRNTYYWYYTTQVMYHMRGPYWERWQQRLYDELLATQVKQGPMAGSWNPAGAVPDRWGAHGGRIYVTAMNLLSLEARTRVNESRAGSDSKPSP
ncbi:MAG: hypothetical protein K8T91_08080 [Planctomycetes bacterium]|nr:hypothetical protein [Planctomycetota bacterium]